MTERNLFYRPYASFTHGQRSLLKVATLYSDKLVALDPISADHRVRKAVRQETVGRIWFTD